jgi:hypothetical protein
MRNAKLDRPWLFSRFTTIFLPLVVTLYFLMWAYWMATASGLLDRTGTPSAGIIPAPLILGALFSLAWRRAALESSSALPKKVVQGPEIVSGTTPDEPFPILREI